MNARNRFVVAAMAILYVFSWAFSLARLSSSAFWNRHAQLEKMGDDPVDGIVAGKSTYMGETGESYYHLRRFIYFLPHVLGAFLWWNLYFLQLVPSIRHANNHKYHRWLGRVLMVTALAQTASGVGLAYTSKSDVVRIVSYTLALGAFYCVFMAWRNARARDIMKHKYWAMRLVGYMQTIALQRFWFFIAIVRNSMAAADEDPDSVSLEQANAKLGAMFEHSFILAYVSAVLVTEWYLAAEFGWMDVPKPTRPAANETLPSSVQEQQPLTTGSKD